MMEILFKRPDATFIIQGPRGPYQVVKEDPLYAEVKAEAKKMGDALAFEPELEAPPPTLDDFRAAIQWQVDETARSRGYDSGVSCASYVGSTNPAWAAEAAAFISYRDAVWSHACTELAKVENGEMGPPKIDSILAELPSINWP